MNKFAFSIASAKKALAEKASEKFVQLMQHGTMQIEYYAPDKIDHQTPHRQDELYVIASGESGFYRNGETIQCKKGDIVFVPAGMEHRFINFSNNFATWVIFIGPLAVNNQTANNFFNSSTPSVAGFSMMCRLG